MVTRILAGVLVGSLGISNRIATDALMTGNAGTDVARERPVLPGSLPPGFPPGSPTTVFRALCRPSQRALIISYKFLNAFGCEFVCKVKAIPWKFEIQVFVRDWFQGPALGVHPFVHEILVRHGEAGCCPFL